jgi:hypothetical protein
MPIGTGMGRGRDETRNQKSEIRRNEENPKPETGFPAQDFVAQADIFCFRIFFIPSGFWFRISDLFPSTLGATIH